MITTYQLADEQRRTWIGDLVEMIALAAKLTQRSAHQDGRAHEDDRLPDLLHRPAYHGPVRLLRLSYPRCMPDATGDSVDRFLRLTREMLDRPDYLLPMAAAQIQFRRDNYQMASASMLEDMFFDTLGTYLRESRPAEQLERRSGKELWDYSLNGLRISHKEAVRPSLSIWWTSGVKVDGKWFPREEYQTYTSPHPIALVLSGPVTFRTGVAANNFASEVELSGPTGARKIAKLSAPKRQYATLLSYLGDEATVEETWSLDEWRGARFHDLWPILGGPGIGARDVWLTRSGEPLAVGTKLTVPPQALLPGIYVLSTDQLVDVPMIANNRAHSFDSAALQEKLLESRQRNQFAHFPLWFATFTESQPPNLYAQQRREYESLFAARQIVEE
ncbi:hypothetical protein [Aeromicrobium sp. CTD01-1L150]|uniref:hypothetical protein n=1 Tax=Aeromicrobium sp. CTD01-1L150 TaxID=3341830 RepID=UPI0035C03DC5